MTRIFASLIVALLSLGITFGIFSASASNLDLCPDSYMSSFENCFGSQAYEDGAKYIGEFSNGINHGWGTLAHAGSWAGDKYVGEVRYGKYNGQGVYTFANGNVFVGTFKDDQPDGWGVGVATDEIYMGEFKDWRLNGQGTFIFNDGDVVIGTFQDHEPVGQAVYIYPDGKIFIGKYEGWENAYGTITYVNGFTDRIMLKDGEVNVLNKEKKYTPTLSNISACTESNISDWHNCYGFYDSGSSKYSGEFRNGSPNGMGFVVYPTGDYAGDKYVGTFRNDFFDGTGAYIFNDGAILVGTFLNGSLNGFGTFIPSSSGEFSGDRYFGEFRDGIYNGQGTYIYADGSIAIGAFKNNSPSWVNLTWSSETKWNGDKYVGQMKEWARHGHGKYIHGPKSELYGIEIEGFWENDEFQYVKKSPNELEREQAKPELKYDERERLLKEREIFYTASGTGFAVSKDGYLVTNNHVINGCQQVKVHYQGKVIPAIKIGFDPQNDLAILKADFIPPAVLTLSREDPDLLEDIFVGGYPFGQQLSTSIKVTRGIISSITGIGNNYSNMQIDAALQPGNSGGPILNSKGHVVGVAVAKLDFQKIFEEWQTIPENTNFGIKASIVRNLLKGNGISIPAPNADEISKKQLGKIITRGTFFLSCWMTQAQIENMSDQKVMFKSF